MWKAVSITIILYWEHPTPRQKNKWNTKKENWAETVESYWASVSNNEFSLCRLPLRNHRRVFINIFTLIIIIIISMFIIMIIKIMMKFRIASLFIILALYTFRMPEGIKKKLKLDIKEMQAN